jgi:hypothetical protein
MQIISDKKVELAELKQMSERMFESLVKAVVDIEKNVMALDAELHSDLETYLLENGSKQRDLWGINLYPHKSGDEFIEFDSMINLRPSQGNRSRGVDDEKTRGLITTIVMQKIAL